MKKFDITLRDLTFPVITNDDSLDQETIELGLDCILLPKSLIPTGVELLIVNCLNLNGGTQWILVFSITPKVWPYDGPFFPLFAEDFALDIKDHILENEEGLPSVKTYYSNDYRTLTIAYHAG